MSNVEAAPAPPRTSVLRRAWERVDEVAWLAALRVSLVSRVVFLGVAIAGTWFLSNQEGPLTIGVLDMWHRWDAVHFTDIATFGYFASETDPNAAAFFPLFPLLIDGLMAIGFDPRLAAMLITFVASIVAGAYLYKLADLEVGEGAGRRALLYLFLFPTAVFLVAPYSEALFLAGAIAAFYYARRASWYLVAIPAAVAMGARLAGLFVLVGLAVEFLRQRDFSLQRLAAGAVAGALGLLPLLLYGLFLSRAAGSFFEFKDAQYRGWSRMVVSPIESFLATWNTWGGSYPANWVFAWRVEILAALVGLFFTLWAFRERYWAYAAYMLVTLGVLMTSTWYFSIPRMLLSLFPIPILLAHYTRGNPERHQNVLLVTAPLATLGVIVFTQGKWFF
ncbi:MAG: hypothetical protein KY391_07635 [Actinobacteria bacterium]|nr:hypothetical protein [Actinomycetota bacterium]